jgi:ligand-binding SRPBCC domain-containing protein
MQVHTLHRKESFPLSLEAAWDFFSDPRNLARITPPELGFEVLTPDLPPRIYAGMMIAYRVRPLAGLPLTWLTEITHLREGEFFVDEQRAGPYALWHHEHRLRDDGASGTEVEDLVTFRLPFGPLGALMHRLVVRSKLEAIFEFRSAAVRKVVAGCGAPPSGPSSTLRGLVPSPRHPPGHAGR